MSAIRNTVGGLYVITDSTLQPPETLSERVERALIGGARVVQYRDKHGDTARRLREASALRGLCERYAATFIVNDDVELARRCGAHGVHLGRDDMALEEARRQLGPERLIGVSCYNELERAERLAAAGADYLAFGSLFPSATKPGAPRASLALIREARARFPGLALVGIGGIDADNAPAAVTAGVDALAVIRAVFGADDPARAAAGIAAAFEPSRPGNAE